MNKTIYIFEDNYNLLKPAFDYVNKRRYNSEFELVNIEEVTDSTDWNRIVKADGIILDIELKESSKRDGYGILEILANNKYDMKHVAILTGHNMISMKLKEKKLPQVEIFYKHIGIEDIIKIFKKFR